VARITIKNSQHEQAICARVKRVRLGLNLSQPQFADQVGLTRDQLANIECARTPLRYDVAWQMRIAFGISLLWLESGHMDPDGIYEDSGLPAPNKSNKTRLLSEVVRLARMEYRRPNDSPSKVPIDVDDISERAAQLTTLRMHLRVWMAQLPPGQASSFYCRIQDSAMRFIEQFPKEAENFWGARLNALVFEEMRRELSLRVRTAQLNGETGKDILDTISVGDNVLAMSAKEVPTWAQLKKTIAKLTAGHGHKAALADELGVSRQVLGNWLSDGEQGAPNAELTLRLFKWSLDPKRQQTK
jgi:transcriptional regulator with XRE-family HTH domain